MHIVADENIPLAEAFFEGLGQVTRLPGRTLRPEQVRGADVLLVRSVTRVDANLLAGSRVGFVGTCTIGTDHLDLDYLAERGIAWANAPGCNANSVVEYVYAALAALNRDWRTAKVGIIGCGRVGGALHASLRRQGVVCRCYDPFLTSAQNPDLTSLAEVLECDILCLHTPLTHSGPWPTYHLLGLAELRQLRPNAVLINAGRGPVVDNQALLQVLGERPDLKVVLDVWEPEPALSPALLQRVALGTPHIAGYSYDGKLKGTEMVYQALCQHLAQAPTVRLASVVPALVAAPLVMTASDEWQALRTLIPQAYDVMADDLNLRALVQAAEAGQADLAEGFDRLRKDYPQRREFHNYRVDTAGADQLTKKTPLAGWLAALGFRAITAS